MAHVALAICPTHACHLHCHANFFIKQLLKSLPVRVIHIQLESLPAQHTRITGDDLSFGVEMEPSGHVHQGQEAIGGVIPEGSIV